MFKQYKYIKLSCLYKEYFKTFFIHQWNILFKMSFYLSWFQINFLQPIDNMFILKSSIWRNRFIQLFLLGTSVDGMSRKLSTGKLSYHPTRKIILDQLYQDKSCQCVYNPFHPFCFIWTFVSFLFATLK